MVIGPSLVVEIGIVQRAKRPDHIDRHLETGPGLESDDRSACRSPAGGNEYYPIGSAHSVECQGRRILEDLHGLYFFGIEIIYVVGLHLKAVHEKLQSISAESLGIRTQTANHHPGRSRAWNGILVDNNQAWKLSLKSFREIRYWR